MNYLVKRIGINYNRTIFMQDYNNYELFVFMTCVSDQQLRLMKLIENYLHIITYFILQGRSNQSRSYTGIYMLIAYNDRKII